MNKFLYLASILEIVISLKEEDVCLSAEGSPSTENLVTNKPGSFGFGKVLSLLSITTTNVMFGLSSG
jgi:hypothetical protein